MRPPRHQMIFANACTASGAARMVMAFVPWRAEDMALEAVAAVIDIGFLMGLLGLYLSLVGRSGGALGSMGSVGFFLAIIGIASIIGPDALLWGIDFYVLGSGVALLGLGIFSVAILQRRHGPRAAALFWLAACVTALGIPLIPSLFIATGFLFGTGFLIAGLWLKAPHRDAASWT